MRKLNTNRYLRRGNSSAKPQQNKNREAKSFLPSQPNAIELISDYFDSVRNEQKAMEDTKIILAAIAEASRSTR